MAVQLDSTAECVVEVPLVDVELFKTSTSADCHCLPFVSNVTHLSLPLLLTTRESRYSHLVTTVTHRS